MQKLLHEETGNPEFPYQLTHPHAHLLSRQWPEVKLSGYWAFINSHGEWLKLKQYYHWDGLSGPAFQTRDTRRATVVHDSLYQLINAGKLPLDPFKLWADQEFLAILKEDGVYFFRRQRMYWAVRLFGRARDEYEI